VPKSNKLKLVGRLTVNGKPLSAVATRVAYVQQEEIFYSQMTVRETLELTATLRLPKRLSAEERTAVVSRGNLGFDVHASIGSKRHNRSQVHSTPSTATSQQTSLRAPPGLCECEVSRCGVERTWCRCLSRFKGFEASYPLASWALQPKLFHLLAAIV